MLSECTLTRVIREAMDTSSGNEIPTLAILTSSTLTLAPKKDCPHAHSTRQTGCQSDAWLRIACVHAVNAPGQIEDRIVSLTKDIGASLSCHTYKMFLTHSDVYERPRYYMENDVPCTQTGNLLNPRHSTPDKAHTVWVAVRYQVA